jgi:hypothetical protein
MHFVNGVVQSAWSPLLRVVLLVLAARVRAVNTRRRAIETHLVQ